MYHYWLWSYAVYWLPVLYVMMVFDNNWTIHKYFAKCNLSEVLQFGHFDAAY